MELVAGLPLEPLAAELTDKLLEVPFHVLPLHVIRQFLHHQAAQVTCKQSTVFVSNIDMNIIVIIIKIYCHTKSNRKRTQVRYEIILAFILIFIV